MVLPDLPIYGEAFRLRLADELEALPSDDCPRRGNPAPHCTALGPYAEDHQWLRDQINAVKGD